MASRKNREGSESNTSREQKEDWKMGDRLVHPRTLQRYNHALLVFFNWLAVTFARRLSTWFELDLAAEQFWETAWASGDPRQLAADFPLGLSTLPDAQRRP